ncbi:MAG TPA: hypothetical protein VMV46_09775 [Thermoanaerobaculia bacterium]|nr:hypothetical protein [Thermoanaerobaculia bacterium]
MSANAGTDAGRENGGSDELYVGYLPETPPRLARFVRGTVVLLGLLTAALASVLALLQSSFDPGVFEFGSTRTLEGRVVERPYPALLLAPPATGEEPPGAPATHLLLVEPGKHGAQNRVAGLEGAHARVTGTLAARPDLAVFELAAAPERLGSLRDDGEVPSAPLREVVLRGEIVDAKCFAGVMKPGRGKVHRSCAARCIAGGIPPVFVAAAPRGGVEIYLLVDADGEPVGERVLEWVGEPIELRGLAEPRGDQTLLRADLEQVVRLGSTR